jgi:hypothetical protein
MTFLGSGLIQNTAPQTYIATVASKQPITVRFIIRSSDLLVFDFDSETDHRNGLGASDKPKSDEA